MEKKVFIEADALLDTIYARYMFAKGDARKAYSDCIDLITQAKEYNFSEADAIKHVEFVSYTGRFPNLCSGILTLKIDGKTVTFGTGHYGTDKETDYSQFWESGGSVSFSDDYSDCCVNGGKWIIRKDDLPDVYKHYAEEIDEVFNENVPHGCCGGCT